MSFNVNEPKIYSIYVSQELRFNGKKRQVWYFEICVVLTLFNNSKSIKMFNWLLIF